MTAKSSIYKTSNFPPLMVAPEDETLALMSRQLLEFLTIPHCHSSDGDCQLWDQDRRQKQLDRLDEMEIAEYSELDMMEQATKQAEIRGMELQIKRMNNLDIGDNIPEVIADISGTADTREKVQDSIAREQQAETKNELFDELIKTEIQLSVIDEQGWEDDKLCVLENDRISERIMGCAIRRRQRMQRMVQLERAWEWQHRKKLIECGLESLSSDLLEGDDESRLALHAAKIREDIQTAQMLKQLVLTRMEVLNKLNEQEQAHKDQLRGKMRQALAEKRSQRGRNK